MSRISVLIVDDSALVRQTLARVLEVAGDFDVAVAADPFIAEKRIEVKRPDVIVLDIEMPGMDGLTFLNRLHAQGRRIPVVICSAKAGEDAGVALEALARGAVEVIGKPRLAVRDYFDEAATRVTDSIRAAAASKRPDVAPLTHPLTPSRGIAVPPAVAAAAAAVVSGAAPELSAVRFTVPLIAIGASTGGTEALRLVLQDLPPHAPPVVVVQHMPEGFTNAFARRLNDLMSLNVREAESGDVLKPGVALIAPGGPRHMRVERATSGGYVVRLDDAPPVNRHRPSVDVLFASVAVVAPQAVGVLMTGMGRDGAQGLLSMRRAGSHTIAQDEATSVVYGMPREAHALGGVSEVAALSDIAGAIIRAAAR